MTIHHGDCVEVMASMEPESVDAIVTDPPYGLEFMGKEWDKIRPTHGNWNDAKWAGAGLKDRSKTSGGIPAADGRPSLTYNQNLKCRTCGKWMRGSSPCRCARPDYEPRADYRAQGMQDWHHRWAREAFRVAKPSAYLLAFGGTRTVHRLAVAIEDAGWIIRDMLVWGYASGFPKSKASLKPAWEPIVMARKPGPLRELAIDACRIATDEVGKPRDYEPREDRENWRITGGSTGNGAVSPLGRWPANIILTDPIFDGGVEGVVGGGENTVGTLSPRHTITAPKGWSGPYRDDGETHPTREYGGDSGTYSRFFILPKADRADREPVLGGLPERDDLRTSGVLQVHCAKCGKQKVNVPGAACACSDPEWVKGVSQRPRANVHPTVKPTELMRHLVRLVTPPGGTVLDPFLGSGTTGLAAEMEGFPWIGIEREAEYVAIAEARLNGTQRGLGLEAS